MAKDFFAQAAAIARAGADLAISQPNIIGGWDITANQERADQLIREANLNLRVENTKLREALRALIYFVNARDYRNSEEIEHACALLEGRE